MSNIQALDSTAHGDLRISMAHGPELGDAINQVQIFATEFEEAQRHYPILFSRKEDGRLLALAVLGFARDENLFLTGQKWDGYVPALIARGPFLIGGGASEDPVIAVDLDHLRICKDEDEGLPLFREHGGHAPALEAALEALRAIHVGNQNAQAMQDAFEEHALLEEANLEVAIDAETTMNFEGFAVITHERIAGLGGASLEDLSRKGFLLPAIFAASSLQNMQYLVMRKRMKDRA
jgi:hypothetical protein